MNRKLFNFIRVMGLMAMLTAAIYAGMQLSAQHRTDYPQFYGPGTSSTIIPVVLLVIVGFLLMLLVRVGAGYASGYRLHWMQLLFMEICKNGKVKLRLTGRPRFGLHMLPPRTDGTSPYRLFLMAAPLSVALLTGGMLLLTVLLWHTPAARELLLMPTVCIAALVGILLPRRNGDLLTQMIGLRQMELRRAWECSAHITAALAEGKNLGEMPDAWFPDKPPVLTGDINVQICAINAASRLMRLRRFAQAYELMRPLYDLRPAPDTHQSIACAILNGAICEALTDLPPMCLSQLDHQSVRYMTPPSWQSRRQMAQYARALLLDHDESQAASLLQELEKSLEKGSAGWEILRLLQEKAGEHPTEGKKGKVHHGKLVRDRIPEIIEASGKKCVTRILSREEYLAALDAKLSEELAEYQADKSMEELADLLEVMMAVAEARGHDFAGVEAIRREKAEKRGSFRERIWLESVTE